MGDLKFSDLGRLMALAASAWAIWSGMWGILFRKFFWDFVAGELGPAGLIPDPSSAPFVAIIVTLPLVQILTIVLGLFTLALEWPLFLFKDTSLWRSHIFRVVFYVLTAAIEILSYQGFDGAVYFLIVAFIYARGMSKGETIADDAGGRIRGGGIEATERSEKAGHV